MRDQIGFSALRRGLMKESEQWAQTLPQLPRLVHQALLKASRDPSQPLEQKIAALEQAQRQTRRLQWLNLTLLVVLTLLLGLILAQPWLL